jgi:hypothetical protein
MIISGTAIHVKCSDNIPIRKDGLGGSFQVFNGVNSIHSLVPSVQASIGHSFFGIQTLYFSAPYLQRISLPLKKKALLIDIQSIRQEEVEIAQDNDERTGFRNGKKEKDKKGAPKEAELKGPHHDVTMQMKELQVLVGALYPFPSA